MKEYTKSVYVNHTHTIFIILQDGIIRFTTCEHSLDLSLNELGGKSDLIFMNELAESVELRERSFGIVGKKANWQPNQMFYLNFSSYTKSTCYFVIFHPIRIYERGL